MDGGQLQQQSTTQPREFVPRDAHKLASADPIAIAERIAEGALQREIAEEYGVTRQAIGYLLSKHIPEDIWASIRRASIGARLERSCEDMERADDALALARARESARLWMWRAEREHPEVWGAKQQVDMRVTTTDLSDRLRAAKARTVDGTAKRVDTVADVPQAVDNAAQQSALTEKRSQS